MSKFVFSFRSRWLKVVCLRCKCGFFMSVLWKMSSIVIFWKRSINMFGRFLSIIEL